MTPASMLPAPIAERPFTRDEALSLGLSRRMLQGRRFRRLSREVYVSATLPLTHSILCQAALMATPGGVLIDGSAVLAHGLPLAVGEREPVRPHVTVAAPLHEPARSLLVAHHVDLPPSHVVGTMLGPATSPARTFLDRANRLCLEDLVALGDAILRRRLASPGELEAIVRWAHARRGVVKARLALTLLDPRAKSPMESWTRVKLVVGGCPAPEVNAPVYDRAGGWIAEGDLVWRAARLIVEYDGIVHLSEEQRRKDLQRRNLLTENGWTVLHVSADDVLRRPWVLINQVNNFLANAPA
jgi:hypothetical protein